MAYRKPYYRKNGTYVSGSNDNRNNKHNNYNEPENNYYTAILVGVIAVSYTHLTLPTNREV